MTSLSLLLTRLPRLGLPPLARWLAVARERRRLGELSDHVLRDIGLTRTEARREAGAAVLGSAGPMRPLPVFAPAPSERMACRALRDC